MQADLRTLDRLLDTALDLPIDAREQWIESLPAEHDAIKPRLRALLARAVQVETSDFLDTLPKFDAGAGADADADADAHSGGRGSETAGDEVGPYRLIREIGAGGMGAVWLAERHDGALKRVVALKFLRAHGPREALAERLVRERDILASLVHPAIARLYDAGISREGLPYLALEYVEGEFIDRYCAAHALDVPARLALFLQVAGAVAYAHGKLVVHRDLKPTNVLVSADGQAHLLDFGIAKLLDDGRALETRLTQVSGRALTPEYASPEQILGQPITIASDIYSLGVLLYELLTDARPYKLKRSSRGALEDAILETEPRAPSDTVNSPSLKRALRGDLDAIVLKALKKQPEARYVTVNALAEDIGRHLRNEPVLAQPDSAWYRARKFVGRNRLATASTTAVFVAVLAGAGVASWQARAALAEKRRAEQVKDFVTAIFADASPWSGSQQKPTAIELLTRARDRVDADPGFDVVTRLELLNVIGESLQGLGASAEAGQIADALVAQSAAQLGEEHSLTLRGRSLRAQALRDQGKSAQMRDEVESMLATLRPQANGQPQATVRALNDLAELELDEARYAEAEATAHEALALAQRHRARWEGRNLERDQAALWKVIAAARESLVDYGPALEAAERSHEHAVVAYRGQPRHPALINSRLVLARIAAHGNMPRAIEMMQQSVTDASDVLGPGHQQVGKYLQNLAVWQARVGDLTAAEAAIARALPILEKEIGADSAHFAAGLDAAAYIALVSRQAQRAVELNERAHAIAIKHLPQESEHPTVMRMRGALARAYLGQSKSAVAELQAIVKAFKSGNFAAPSRPYLALGEAQRLEGDFHAALASQQAGIALIVESPSADRERMSFLTEIGLDYVALGEPAKAAESLERGLRLIAQHQTHVTPLRADALAGLGRAQLALGKHAEAVESLAAANAFWQSFAPESRWTAEAALWLGRAITAGSAPDPGH